MVKNGKRIVPLFYLFQNNLQPFHSVFCSLFSALCLPLSASRLLPPVFLFQLSPFPLSA